MARPTENSRKICLKAAKIVDEAYERKRVSFGGKSKKGIVAGLFYCLDRSLGSFETQKEIARNMKTTEMTVRASPGDWSKQFPT